MSERRKPDIIVRVYQPKTGKLARYELFAAGQFTSRRWADQPTRDEHGNPTYRLRYNDVWLPREPKLLPLAEILDLVHDRCRELDDMADVSTSLLS